MKTSCKILGRIAACAVLLVGYDSASAGVISAQSSAYGVSVDLNIGLATNPLNVLVSAEALPLPTVSGTAPGPYGNANSLASASANGQLSIRGLGLVELIRLDTGLLEVNAQSNVDGGAGNRTTSADATVNNVQLLNNTVAGLVLQSLLTLDATQVQSTAQITGGFGTLDPSGTTTITGTHGVSGNQALLTVLGVEVLLDSTPAPNTTLTIDSSVPGLSLLQGSIDVILNEQILAGDMATSQSIDVNAIHLRINDLGVNLGVLGAGLLSGDVIISHSEASQLASEDQVVPEPGSMSLLAFGMFGLAGMVHRRRKRR